MKTSFYVPDDLAAQAKAHDISVTEVARQSLQKAIAEAETGGIEYHWMLCYVVPQPEGGYIQRQRSGVRRMTERTRLDAFEVLAQAVADDDGITAADFSVTFFSLEPNQLGTRRD